MNEEAFEITYQVGTTPYRFDVYPYWDDVKEESYFVISLDGEDIGTIRKTENDTWEWISGGLQGVFVEGVETDFNTADDIGNMIDAHYD